MVSGVLQTPPIFVNRDFLDFTIMSKNYGCRWLENISTSIFGGCENKLLEVPKYNDSGDYARAKY